MRYFVVFLFVVLSNFGFSQTDSLVTNLKGTVIHNETKLPMGNVHVINTTRIKGTVTSPSGTFEIPDSGYLSSPGTVCPKTPLHIREMTETDISKILIEGDTVTIMGVRYQRIIEPQSFYDKLYGLLDDNLIEWVDTDGITIRVLDLIRENIPEYKKGVGLPEYNAGWNDAIKTLKDKLR